MSNLQSTDQSNRSNQNNQPRKLNLNVSGNPCASDAIPLTNLPVDTVINTAIDTTNFYQADDLIIDATQHNSAIRLVKGKYQKIRRWIATPLIALFVLAPWLTMNDNPLLQMDLETRQLHVFGINFWPDDLLILVWVAMASAFALFAVANFAGRLWCGFSCPQTVWSMMFVWVEEKIEGSRNQRLKQKNAPLTASRLSRFIIKHTVWLMISFITGFTFVAFFETGPSLFQDVINLNVQSDVTFWLVFFTSLTYINAGWLREQVCLHMCPYSRFQSVMLDSKSLKVSYDVKRGEPRKCFTKPSSLISSSNEVSEKTGDCVNCQLCVQVCPVGIDIRQGMQYACIDCGACIDACDEIMERISLPKGLIRFSNEQNLHWTELFKNRTRFWSYCALTVLAGMGFIFQVSYMESFDAHLNRDRGQLYFYDGAGNVQNAYSLKVHNKTSDRQNYQVTLTGPNESSLTIASKSVISVAPGERKTSNLLISCESPCMLDERTDIDLSLVDKLNRDAVFESVFFNAPLGRL